jgi:hypothetical protein
MFRESGGDPYKSSGSRVCFVSAVYDVIRELNARQLREGMHNKLLIPSNKNAAPFCFTSIVIQPAELSAHQTYRTDNYKNAYKGLFNVLYKIILFS